MPSLKSAHLGRAMLAGLFGLCATGALAGTDPQLLVSQRPDSETRVVEVRLSDLDLTNVQGLQRLSARVDRAAREACGMWQGSALNNLPSAKTCHREARAGALAQLEARGLPRAASAAIANDLL